MRPSQYQRMLQELKDARGRDDVLLDQLRESLHVVALTVAAAKAKAQSEENGGKQ